MTTSPPTIIVGSEGKGSFTRDIIDHVLRLAFGNVAIQWQQTDSPHIIVRSGMFGQEGELPTKTQVPYIVWSAEPFSVRPRNYLPIFTVNTAIDGSYREIHIPYAALGLAEVLSRHGLELPNFRKNSDLERPYFVAYCNSRGVPYREKMFQLLRHSNPTAHGLGACSNTGYQIPGLWTNTALIDVYASYRFVIAMENCYKPGYVTEKIINAFASGAIPIYAGDADTARSLFNPEAFVCLNDFPSIESCVDFIIELDKDTKRRQRMMQAPIFKGEVPACCRYDHRDPSDLYLDLAARIRRAVQV